MKVFSSKRVLVRGSVLASLISCQLALAAPSTIEVMHPWSSPGEAYALDALKEAVSKAGLKWQDSAIAGNNGANQQQALQARLAAGNPPDVAQTARNLMESYIEQGFLVNLDSYAKEGGWATKLSPELARVSQSDGHYYSVPLGEHRENMMWTNKSLLDKYGGKMPQTWEEFDAIADKMQKDGVIPVALGGEDWQEAQMFSSVILGVGGRELYQKAVVEHDSQAIKSEQMVKAFDRLRKLIGYTDRNRAGRDWNAATQMVIDGKAGFQFLGDFVKGEFFRAGKKPGEDFLCSTGPNNGKDFVFIVDSFVFFKQNSEEHQQAQKTFANLLLDPTVQTEFNKRKGSIPVLQEVAAEQFDTCAQLNLADRKANQGTGGMLPSFVENVAQEREVRGVFIDVITHFANTPSMTSKEAVERLASDLENL